MKIQLRYLLSLIIVISLISCGTEPNNQATQQEISKQEDSLLNNSFAGNYVDDGYVKRAEGYDWIAVLVKQVDDSLIQISIRSRNDRKKPTCTFDATAVRISKNQFRSNFDGKSIVYTFEKNTINIATENPTDNEALQYYCSGGGNFAGMYKMIEEPIDKNQIDPRIFTRMLSYQNISFDISTTGEGAIQKLTIQPYGLKIDNSKFILDIEGSVTNAEIGDLNIDGFPEVLIYTTSAGSGSYGNVIGFSVNNGKSISQISFPAIADIPGASKGYMGHDEFAIVENTLIQRFKLYSEGDRNSNPTGKFRQIQYKMKNGESSRIFVVDKIVEF